MDEPANDISTPVGATLELVVAQNLNGFLEKEDRLYNILHLLNDAFEEKLAALASAQIKRSLN